MPTGGTLEERRAKVLVTYTDEMLKRRRMNIRYSCEQTLQYVGWLARVLTQQAQTVFYLERLESQRTAAPGIRPGRRRLPSAAPLLVRLSDPNKKNRPQSVAMQVVPDDGPFDRPQAVRRYLEKYFGESKNIKMRLFWGTGGEFARELWRYRKDWQ